MWLLTFLMITGLILTTAACILPHKAMIGGTCGLRGLCSPTPVKKCKNRTTAAGSSMCATLEHGRLQLKITAAQYGYVVGAVASRPGTSSHHTPLPFSLSWPCVFPSSIGFQASTLKQCRTWKSLQSGHLSRSFSSPLASLPLLGLFPKFCLLCAKQSL